MIIGKTRTNQPVESDTGFDKQVEEVATTLIEGAESGTFEDVLGLDSNGKLVKGAVSGGTKLYKHSFPCNDFIKVSDGTVQYGSSIFYVISTTSTPFATLADAGADTGKINCFVSGDKLYANIVFYSPPFTFRIYAMDYQENLYYKELSNITDTVTAL